MSNTEIEQAVDRVLEAEQWRIKGIPRAKLFAVLSREDRDLVAKELGCRGSTSLAYFDDREVERAVQALIDRGELRLKG